MNISIISDCNNNCSFCFQKDFHKKHQILSYEEIEDIIEWGKEEQILILGGEPTLHPDIVKIMHTLSEIKAKDRPLSVLPQLITNILGETEVFKELAKIRRISFLINTNYSEHLKDRYHNNFSELMNRLLFIRIGKEVSISITLTGIEEQDTTYINKLFETLSLYHKIIKGVRIGICTPDIEISDYKLINHDSAVKYIVKRVTNEYKGVYCYFDCLPNNCQISHQAKCELNVTRWFLPTGRFCTDPIIDILPDKSVVYCFSGPDELKIDSYKRFKNVAECRSWYQKNLDKFLPESKFYCQLKGSKPDCDFCEGCCVSINKCLKSNYIINHI